MVGAQCLQSSHPWPTSGAHRAVAIRLGLGSARAASAVIEEPRTRTIPTETHQLPPLDHLGRFLRTQSLSIPGMPFKSQVGVLYHR